MIRRNRVILARLLPFSRPFGTYTVRPAFPALKRRAILTRPSGTLLLGRVRCPPESFTVFSPSPILQNGDNSSAANSSD